MLGPFANYLKDGQPPKRRGPKPDSKPALTRRQELNRQAQRFVFRFHTYAWRRAYPFSLRNQYAPGLPVGSIDARGAIVSQFTVACHVFDNKTLRTSVAGSHHIFIRINKYCTAVANKSQNTPRAQGNVHQGSGARSSTSKGNVHDFYKGTRRCRRGEQTLERASCQSRNFLRLCLCPFDVYA